MRLRLAILLCLPATALVANPFSDGPVDWSGSGVYRPALEAELDSMRCRGTTEPTESGFSFAGRCASPAASATMELEATLGATDVEIVLTASILSAPMRLVGRHDANGIAATATQPIEIGEDRVDFSINIFYSEDGGFILTEYAVPLDGGAPVEIAQILYAR